MASSLIRGKYVVAKVASRTEAEVIPDGAVFQRDGTIVEVGRHADLAARHRPDEVLGSSDHVVVPGFVNAHHHVGLTPFQLDPPTIRSSCGSPAGWRRAVSTRILTPSIPRSRC